MKKVIFFFFLFTSILAHSQQFRVDGAGTNINGYYNYSGMQNGRPTYQRAVDQLVNISYNGAWQIKHVINGTYYSSSSTSMYPPVQGWQVASGSAPAPTISYIIFDKTNFKESYADDGTLENAQNIKVLCKNDSFTGTIGEDFIANTKVTLNNLPAGFSASLIKTNDTTLLFSIVGAAISHTNADDINTHITFSDAAFSGGSSANILINPFSVQLNFIDVWHVGSTETHTSISSAISASSSGDVLLLAAETFTENGITIPHSLVIKGMGATQTIVQAAASPNLATERVFTLNQYIQVEFEKLSIQNGNTNGMGGGIYAQLSRVSIKDCEIRNNTAGSGGGGIYFSANDTITIEHSTIAGNTSNEYGGGVLTSGSTFIARNSTISGNTGSLGGGISSSKMIFENCTITDNTATLTGHDVQGGGGIFVNSGWASLRNTIVASNHDPNNLRPDIRIWYSSPLISHGNNFIGNVGTDGFPNNTAGDIYFDPNNNTAPYFTAMELSSFTNPLDNTLQLNGGETRTHALLAGSLPINPVNSNGASTEDQRHLLRWGTADIGAFEYNGQPNCSVNAVANDTTFYIQAGETIYLSAADLGYGSTTSCGGNLSYTLSQSDFTCADLGSQQILLTITDPISGYTDTASATITITTPALSIQTLPAIEQTVNAENCTAILTLPNPTINTCNATITNDAPTHFSVGNTSVTWTAITLTDTVTTTQLVTITNDLTSSVSTNDISCATPTGGEIQLNISGGTLPYSVNWNNGTYNTQNLSALSVGNYHYLVVDANGCESEDSTNIAYLPLDITTIRSGATIVAEQANANYQWINCDDLSVVNNETNRIFNATINGSYAVVITQNFCIDTSACVNVYTLSVNEFSTPEIHVFPNPNKGNFTITGLYGIISIFNGLGVKVYEQNNITYNSEVNLHTLPSGVYYMRYTSMNGSTGVHKLVIENL